MMLMMRAAQRYMSRMSRVTELPIEVDPFTLNLELFVSVQARLGMYSSWNACINQPTKNT